MRLMLQRYNTRENLTLGFLILFVVVIAIVSPRYAQPRNLGFILDAAVVVGMIAIAETVLLIGGNVDISVGAILGASSIIVSSMLVRANLPVPVAIAAGILMGTSLGAANGVLVAYLGVPSIIATLASLRIMRGILALFISGGGVPTAKSYLYIFSTGRVGDLTLQVIILFVVGILAAVFLSHTRLGRTIYAMGGNEGAAMSAGVKVKQVKFLTFVISGFIIGICAVLHAARAGYTLRSSGEGTEFIAIAAVVMGGVSLTGGAGSIKGAVIGTILLYAIYNAMIFARIDAAWQSAVTGALILLAVSVDYFRRRQVHD